MSVSESLTVESLSEMIRAKMEDEERPNNILNVLRTHNGKILDKRLALKIAYESGEQEAYIDKYISTHLKFGRFVKNDNSISLLISYEIKSVRIDCAFIEEHNTAYFEARQSRNRERLTLLANKTVLEMIVFCVNSINKSTDSLNKLIEYGAIGGVERFTIRDLIKKD